MITSAVFWAFLLASVVVYWLLPRWRSWFLFVASAGYLATLDWKSVAALFGMSVAFYLASQRWKARPKFVDWILILGALGYLATFKYVPPLYLMLHGTPPASAAASVLVPLGASYFTFKLIHYIIESSRKNIPDHPPDTFLAYMFFFPMYTAGPIERFDAFLKNRAAKLTREHVGLGLTRILFGLVKKLVFVDLILSRTAVYDPTRWYEAIPIYNAPFRVEQLVQDIHVMHPAFVWHFLINQFLTLYLDFSAYSDIALGTALLFGVKLCENFDYPIFATNISDYWRRWHMSLSGWCQQYVYLPTLARTRNPYAAVYMTMAAIGLWHAGNLNHLCWGLYHATFISIYLSWGRFKRSLRWRPKSIALTGFSWTITFLGVTAAYAFPATKLMGIRAAFRVLARLVNLPLAPG